jgi:hypothetical protein
MNKVNVQKAIDIMKRAGNLDMRSWQGLNLELCETEEDLRSCGTAACLAGWIAVSPDWKADGGDRCWNGSPLIEANERTIDGVKAIAYWLDIPFSYASKLCATFYPSKFYNVPTDSITKEMVIEKLEGFLEKDNLFCYI